MGIAKSIHLAPNRSTQIEGILVPGDTETSEEHGPGRRVVLTRLRADGKPGPEVRVTPPRLLLVKHSSP